MSKKNHPFPAVHQKKAAVNLQQPDPAPAREQADRELAELRRNNQDLQHCVQDLKAQYHLEQAAHIVADREINRIINDFSTLESRYRELQQHNNALLERVQELELQVRNDQRENLAANREIARITQDFATLEKDSRALQQELQEYQRHFICRLSRLITAQTATRLFGSLATRFIPDAGSSAKIRFRHWCYRHLPALFANDPGLRQYQTFRKRRRTCSLEKKSGLVLPDDLPLTSIIIVADTTEADLQYCLHTLLDPAPAVPFEIVVVRNGQPGPSRMPERPYTIREICPEQPLSATAARNLGAEQAQGEYLVFLASDALLLPGWLDELATALYHHADAGMIGAQLVDFETGKIAENGSLICRNGWIVPLGRGEELLHPDFSFFQQVPAVSGTAAILRREDFVQQNGLDPRYTAADMAFFDLCFRLCRDGRRHYVMPLARVLKSGTEDAAEENTRNNNKNLFLETWQTFISENAPYNDLDDYRTCRRYPARRVLFLDAETPMPDRGSGCIDTVYFLDYLQSRGFDVVFHAEYTPGYVKKYTPMLLRKGIRCICQPAMTLAKYLGHCGGTFQYLFVSRVYQAQCFDRVLQAYCRNAVYIFNTVDLHFVREKREAEISGSAATMRQSYRTCQLELTFATRADATIVISNTEKDLLEQDFGLSRIWHIPQVRPAARSSAVPENRQNAVFIGSAHRPNQDALKYFHDEILPFVLEQHPDFHLTIIGEALRDAIKKNPQYASLLDCPQFTFAGHVDELGDYLDSARLTIAPLRYGAGTKGKVTSSMAYGVPCVSSPTGVEGTGMRHGIDLLVGDTPEQFAAAISRLLTDDVLWQNLSQGGFAFLRDNNDEPAISARMDQLLADATAHKEQVEREFQAIGDAQQLVAFNAQLSDQRTAADDQHAMLNAILKSNPHRLASIYFMQPEPEIAALLQQNWPNLLSNQGPCPPPDIRQGLGAAFDVIAFHSCPSRSALKRALVEAIQRLYHGGRVFFPCPREPEMLKHLFDDLRSAEYQLIFCVPTTPGNGCICVQKAIPRNEESEERW